MLGRVLNRLFTSTASVALNKRSVKEFYKAIHPDLLEKAPIKVKEENLRSLKLLNDYLDRIKNNSGSQTLPLKFYAPNKENSKSKKFLYFEVVLDSFNPNSDSDYLKIHESRIMNKLLSSLTTIQLQNNPFASDDKILKSETVERNFEETHSDLFVKSSSKMDKVREIGRFKKMFNDFTFENQKEELTNEIKSHLIIMYPELDNHDSLVSQVVKELSVQKVEDQMVEMGIDPNIYFISTAMKPKFTHIYFKKLIEHLSKHEAELKYYKKIQAFVQNNQPRIKILISKKEDVSTTFITIDADKSIEETLKFIGTNIGGALEKREVYNNSNQAMQLFKSEIEKDFGLKFIDIEDTSEELSDNKKYLFLKKLIKALTLLKGQESNHKSIEKLHVKLSQSDFRFERKSNKMFLPWNFDESKVIEFMTQN
jgi:hypothetical protein